MLGTNVALPSYHSVADSFTSYLSFAYSQPALTEEREQELFSLYRENDDLDAVRQIVLSHLRFVVYIAKSFSGYKLPMEDLVQEGSIGLMKAVKRFDLGYGVRFASFAVHWVKAEIQEYVVKNWKLVKVATTKAQRKLFFNLRGLKKRIGWMNSDEIKEVATYLEVNEKEVIEMENRLRQADEFFDESFGDSLSDDELLSGSAPAKLLADESTCPEQLLLEDNFHQSCLAQIRGYVEELDDRSKDILMSRWLIRDEQQRVSQKELAEKYQVSSERIRQIETNVINKLKRKLEDFDIDTC